MKPRERKPKPDKETLKIDFERLGSKAKLAHAYGVSAQTAHRWLRESNLVEPLPSDAQDENRLERWKEKPQTEPEVIEGELLTSHFDEQKSSIIPVSSSQQSSSMQTPDPETAFEQLSQTQKRAVAILADRPALTGKELAVEVGVSEQTVVSWKQSPVFQEAIREMLVPAFRTEALLMVMADLKRVVQTGKARPEDRKLLAEISGLAAGDQVNVQVNLAQDGFFGRRWRG